jgi:hypothetical protein
MADPSKRMDSRSTSNLTFTEQEMRVNASVAITLKESDTIIAEGIEGGAMLKVVKVDPAYDDDDQRTNLLRCTVWA